MPDDRRPARATISLSRELWLVLHALQGIRHLADHGFELPAGTRAVREVLSALSASISLMEARLMMLDRVIRDSINPAVLWCEANDAGLAIVREQDADVNLVEWGPKRAVKRARQELRRAKRYLRHQRAEGSR